ncbi:hypothetical protein OOT46_02375 [Aquabacterium sp. A7-Y]|uniref:hypothetical protein n=1 Tax=Aquabacterium sp. A7-Y TaxID=1349605 RepID=UPI00223CD542|nr:hypothetical protein [Aquabacterium sp. A7-Y]MCW7536700.1 hypothetical protein [Aquabacterium sp. A7-Y]
MATLPGSLLPGSIVQEPTNYRRSPEISEFERVTYPFDTRDSAASASGAKADTQPVDELRLPRAGSYLPTFVGDWYHRIHLIPARIDLGNVISPVERRLEVWNAHLDAHTLNAIEATATDGLTLSGQPEPPLAFGPLQTRLYRFTASSRGAPLIDARYTFRFASGLAAVLPVTGRRVVVFGIRPNWADGITERLEWLTEVLEAHDGTEQRIRLRQMPRRGFEYGFLLEGQDARVLDHLLFAWGGRTYCLPVWTDIAYLPDEVKAGAMELQVQDAANSDYHPGGMAVLWRSVLDNEAVQVLAVEGNTLTLNLALGRSWPAGTQVFPARLARLEGQTAVRRITDTLAEGRCRFTVEDLTAPVGAEAGLAYQGYQIFDWPPNRSEDVEDNWQRKLTVLDHQTGARGFEDESGIPQIGRRLSWLLPDRVQVSRFRAWLAMRAGRANPAWLPTFESDLVVTRPVATADSGITVRNVGYSRFVAAHPQRRDLVLRTTAGVFYRRVTGGDELSADEELISLDAPLGVTVAPAQFLQISWLELARLDQDAVELFWETDQIARLQLSTRTLPS